MLYEKNFTTNDSLNLNRICVYMTHPSLIAVRPGDSLKQNSSDEVKYAKRSQQAITDKGKKSRTLKATKSLTSK